MADYGRDIAYAHTTTTGDLPTIEGEENLSAALLRRWFTDPGTFVYRPDYGGGVLSFRNLPMTIENQRKIASRIEQQSMQDARVEGVRSIQFTIDDPEPSMIKVTVKIKPVGQNEITVEFDDLGG
jgi:hypothetical protein